MANRLLYHLLLGLISVSSALYALPVSAVPMINDPNGFQNISWGTALAGRAGMTPSRTGSHITEYRSTASPATFAGAEMTSILLLSIDDQFARVTIRYQGEQTHAQVMRFLETEFGPLERIPGQMARGLNQQYNWRGPETEINVTYQASTERGFIFIDSRTLAPRFNDYITDSAE
ncbi:hypothetical protein [Nitrospira lenta]|uniref:Uncharacterized protein n=1 Tax=Nitrospira lenta TaxID=1436998 RepID=A0A330L1R3_9BACT|nr:hypothetical protein [Nitrospira lenta]SPP63670.1 conserved exported hypothetical protein [Nitrospira lenta]